MSDEELLTRCAQGDVAAFDLLYRRYSRTLYRYILGIVNDDDTADDLFQESFVRVLTKAQTWRPIGKVSTWLYTIATNLCYSELRRRKQSRFSPLVQEHKGIPAKDNPRRSAESHEIGTRIQEALRMLPDNQRIAFSLRHHQGLSYDEIACVLRCPVGTVKSRVHAALLHLRSQLHDLLKEIKEVSR